ncbi:DinB family protein [Paenibacillus flagellatus]|uniref:DUF1572 domain-containing protein n=1 Tax=Paenibacillus flagellatus TaxID=2211139 RepID=A0A2V5KDI5_9BACL|nr:DinB family protein [Paenibacillus flagellatus]PYI56982.1 hypothetical protein DLM86_00605 [Paenibacillus flagellatus]
MQHLDSSAIVIDLLLRKYKADQKWTRIVLEQLTDEDIVWSPTPESNSIANLVAHIAGAVHQWFETAYFGAPFHDRSKEFERGLQMSKEQALQLSKQSYDCILRVLDIMKENPEKLLERPYVNFPTFKNAGLDNQSTVLEMLLHQFRHLPGHTGQLIYIAKMRKGHLVWE